MIMDCDIDELLGALDKRSQAIIEARFVYNRTWKSIADEFQISSERARQISDADLKQIRHVIWKKCKGWESMVRLATECGLPVKRQ